MKIKVNHQGQVTELRFSEILDIENVRIDTKIESISCIQPEINKAMGKMCMTLSSKVKRLRYVNYFNIYFDMHPAFGTNCLAICHLSRLSRFSENISSTTFFSRPATALSLQPSRLFCTSSTIPST